MVAAALDRVTNPPWVSPHPIAFTPLWIDLATTSRIPLESALADDETEEARMRRRSGALLSPNEETTLRRVADGGTAEGDHTTQDVRRLTAFELIKIVGGRFVLTGAGRRRVDRLRPQLNTTSHDQAAYGEAGKILSQFYTRCQRHT
jgi:hypothetical protein